MLAKYKQEQIKQNKCISIDGCQIPKQDMSNALRII